MKSVPDTFSRPGAGTSNALAYESVPETANEDQKTRPRSESEYLRWRTALLQAPRSHDFCSFGELNRAVSVRIRRRPRFHYQTGTR